jgi:hypothetical protein
VKLLSAFLARGGGGRTLLEAKRADIARTDEAQCYLSPRDRL